MSENSLNNKLNRIDETLLVMKNNLGLSENEVIENLATATNLHTLANIFIQEEEPSTKDGIWIQTDGKTHPYDTVRIDGDIIIPGAWRFDLGVEIIKNRLVCSCVYENMFYFIIGSALYSFDFNTKIISILVENQAAGSNGISKIWANNKYIFINGNDWIYTYDLTGQNIQSYKTGNIYPACACIEPDSSIMYFYEGGYRGFYKYDVINNTNTLLCTFPWNTYFESLYQINNTQILCFVSGTSSSYLFDISSNTYTTIQSLDRKFGTVVNVLGNSLYTYLSNEKAVFKINLTDYTYQNIKEQFFNNTAVNFTNFQNLMYYNGKYYALDYDNSATWIIPQDVEEIQYNDSSIVIFQAPIHKSDKQTALWTYPCLKGRMCQSFFDIYYYNKETGFDFTLPTYYGDGEQWVKFKN